MAERAEAAPYIDYRPTPRWIYAAAGGWCAFVVGLRWFDDSELPGKDAVQIGGVVVMIALVAAFVAWHRRYYGFRPPSLWSPKPREIRSAYLGYLVGVAVVIALIALTFAVGGWPAATGVAGVAGAGGYWLYDRAYAGQAAKVRARLGDRG